MRVLMMVLLGLLAVPGQAALVSLFDAQRLPQASPDPAALARCRGLVGHYPGYDGDLQMVSKYDQGQASKDRLDPKAAHQYRQQVEYIYAYLALLGRLSGYMVSDSAAVRSAAATCFDEALTPWAEQGSLAQAGASKQDEAVRKWFLAALATDMMKASALTQWQPDARQRRWVSALADRVQAHAAPRRQRMDLYNNHDYWSCWAVMAAALVLDEPDRLQWAVAGYWLAIGQITPRQGGMVLPHEAARGKRAAQYHAFALTPLILIAEAGTRNGLPLYQGKGQSLHGLAAQVVHLWRHDGQGATFKVAQLPIEDDKMAWWPVYAHRFADRLPLPPAQAGRFGSRFTGGSLAGLWLANP
ncbi:poly(beta-D-mannuronate) lyase [Alcanivorax hongdengensis A-11-3]|uniref:Poly(Beta-D-mannuronate) lyase n=1 Tax=Alcanivorax hongdengensis A-11-3 TaxID=1177179 RepID=L0WCC6_9GAMM|nr:alginate lyase family protein [Alcanivorax hongdengensis]EKF74408.1 poly(beta-D-mannuronate) lyase [Alcanivorax hongdengensis A-11-3]